MKVFASVTVALGMAAALMGVTSDSEVADRPNILLIMSDDMGFTDIGSFGGEIATPNIDALASGGVRFSNFHTSVSCSPTRSMLMTGTDNHIAGLGNMGELLTPEQVGRPGYEGHLNDRVVTLAEVLRDGGYHTYMAGKWHLGHEPEQIPHARGFDRSFSMLDGGASHWSDMIGIQAEIQPMARYVVDDVELSELPGDFYSSRSYADFLIDAIRQNRGDGQPFFAYLAPTAAHDPIHVPEPWLSKYSGQYDEGWEVLKARRIEGATRAGLVAEGTPAPARLPGARPWNRLRLEEKRWESRTMEAYAGMVENMDYHVGRVIDFLKDIGEYDNTIIIYTSDNGPNPIWGEEYPGNPGNPWMDQFDNSLENIGRRGSFVGYGYGWASAGAGPLDYYKLTVGEGGIRTPLIISGPGVEGPRLVDSFAYVTDLMPTLLEVTGIDHPGRYQGREVAPMRGRSLIGVLTGRQARTYAEADVVAGEMNGGRWVRRGDFKATAVAPPFGDGQWRLYDVTRDPGETQDLSGAQPGLLEDLTAAWERYAEETGVVVGN